LVGVLAGATGNGSDNTAVGYQSLVVCNNSNNACFGAYSGNTITNGTENICVGYNAGGGIVSGSNNITIGYNSTVTTDVDNQAVIGNGSIASFVPGKNGAYCGNGTNNWVYGGTFETGADTVGSITIADTTAIFELTGTAGAGSFILTAPTGFTGRTLIVRNSSTTATTSGLITATSSTTTFIYNGTAWV